MRAAAWIPWLLCVVVTSVCQSGFAQNLSLPLEGYFHPGRAMPVRWDLSSPPTAETKIELSAPGAVTSRVQLTASQHGVFPWLVIDRTASTPQINTPLHPLESSDFLVATALEDDSSIRDLFSGRSVMVIHLDAAEEIEGPPMAWETLDAIVFSPTEYSKLLPSYRNGLFAAGVELVVAGDSAPDVQSPWKRWGRFWIVDNGSRSVPIISPDAYAPTWGWTAGRSGEFRTRVFLLGVIFCLAVSGVALWRSHWMPASVAALCIVFGAATIWGNIRQSPIARASGNVELISFGGNVDDEWTYLLAHRAADFSVPMTGSMHPILSDESQFQTANLTLICDDAGNPTELTGRLKPDAPLALVNRRIAPEPASSSINQTAQSPMRALAVPSIYAGFSIVGQAENERTSSGAYTIWPTVYLHNSSAQN